MLPFLVPQLEIQETYVSKIHLKLKVQGEMLLKSNLLTKVPTKLHQFLISSFSFFSWTYRQMHMVKRGHNLIMKAVLLCHTNWICNFRVNGSILKNSYTDRHTDNSKCEYRYLTV